MAKRILVADDEPNMVRLIKVNLERAGFEVCDAANGQEALVRLGKEPPIDLLITDVMMPVLDGFALLQQARQQPAHASLPVIVMGSLRNEVMPDDPPGTSSDDILQNVRRGIARISPHAATDYLVKPFNPSHMVQMVRLLLMDS